MIKPYEMYVNISDKASIGPGSNREGVHIGAEEINRAVSMGMRVEEAKAKGQRLVLTPYDNRFGNMYTKGGMQYNKLDGTK